MGVFLRDPSPYLREFWRKPRKFRTARSTSTIGVRTWHLPSSSFERYCCATGGTCLYGNTLSRLLNSLEDWSGRFVVCRYSASPVQLNPVQKITVFFNDFEVLLSFTIFVAEIRSGRYKNYFAPKSEKFLLYE